MSRPRRRDRRDWPSGLYEKRPDGLTSYYSYRDPLTKRELGLGSDLQAAIAAVRLVERKRALEPVQAALARIESPAATTATHVKWFLEDHLPSRKRRTGEGLAKGTLDNYRLMLGRVRKEWGSRPITAIDRRGVVDLLDEFPPETANRFRSVLFQFFRHAQARGLRDDNPVEGTVKKDVVAQRERLTKAQFDDIRAKAPPWLQTAMDLSLLSLQRPGDLCRLKTDSWDGEWWHVRQSKSKHAGYGRIRFKPHKELKRVIKAAMKARVEDCPYLLCREPEKRVLAIDRDHWGQLNDQILSRTFAEIRDHIGIGKDLPDGKSPPSYYEIKALGALLYEQAGRAEEWIQLLAGHRETKTTRIYLDRHAEKWREVVL